MELVLPSSAYLAGHVAALERGWSADSSREAAAAQEELTRIQEDAGAFVQGLVDREAQGRPVTLPDGSIV
ncbi:MAG: GNAT family N-acetyltransferase, partial [Burkholderiaceae bacterium]|nr:GNAT family N-acetyltransferase [Burkholderiaceae bacterium]